MKLLFALLICVPAYALAGAGEFSEAGEFSSLPGVGYQISGNYTATGGEFTFGKSLVDKFSVGGGAISLGLVANGDFTASDSADISLQMDVRFINLATGEAGLPAALFVPSPFGGNDLLVSGSGFGSANVVRPADPEIRFSYSAPLLQNIAVSNQFGSLIFGSSSYACTAGSAVCPDPGLAADFIRLEYTLSFRGGHFLMPSSDPSCASFACMTPGNDFVEIGPIGVQLRVAAIPEPSAYTLFVLGLAGIFAYLRRRSS